MSANDQTSRKVMDLLSQDVTFDVGELRGLNNLFMRECQMEQEAIAQSEAKESRIKAARAGKPPSPKRGGGSGKVKEEVELDLTQFQLGRHQFCEVVCREYPSLTKELATQLFDSFDEDGSGYCDLREFTIGLLKVAVGTTAEKLELVFEVLDSNGDGSIGISELLGIVKRGNDECMAITHFTSEIVHTLDKVGYSTCVRSCAFAMRVGHWKHSGGGASPRDL